MLDKGQTCVWCGTCTAYWKQWCYRIWFGGKSVNPTHGLGIAWVQGPPAVFDTEDGQTSEPAQWSVEGNLYHLSECSWKKICSKQWEGINRCWYYWNRKEQVSYNRRGWQRGLQNERDRIEEETEDYKGWIVRGGRGGRAEDGRDEEEGTGEHEAGGPC